MLKYLKTGTIYELGDKVEVDARGGVGRRVGGRRVGRGGVGGGVVILGQ
ncbi:MAG: hypothetical protein QXG15_04505 [Desulfurococcaceae archaeon]